MHQIGMVWSRPNKMWPNLAYQHIPPIWGENRTTAQRSLKKFLYTWKTVGKTYFKTIQIQKFSGWYLLTFKFLGSYFHISPTHFTVSMVDKQYNNVILFIGQTLYKHYNVSGWHQKSFQEMPKLLNVTQKIGLFLFSYSTL